MKKRIIATSIVSVLASSPVFADVTAQSGVYVGGLGGWSFASSPNQPNGFSKTNKNFTWGGTLGYAYAMDQNFLLGAEASYLNFGKTEYAGSYSLDGYTGQINENIKNSGVQLMLTGTYLMNDGFNTFVKLGAIHEKTADSYSANVSDNGSNVYSYATTANVVQWVPAAAIGIGYMPVQNLNIALQYEHTFGANWNQAANAQNLPSKPMTQDALTLGLIYTFPL